MATEEKKRKRLVIISVGIELSPVFLEFLHADLDLTIILNTTADFSLAYKKNGEETKEDYVWYHHEVVKLANSIVPDDLTESALTKLFSQPISQTRLPLTEAEMFLVQWVSERKKANQSFNDFFNALNQYSGKSLDVYPLKFPDKAVSIKTAANEIPLRYFQITGFIDRNADQKTDLEELQKLLVDSSASKIKKKTKRQIEVVGLDPNREVLTEETKKLISESDAILWLAGDPCSLAILLLHKEFTKVIKESKAPATMICPTQFSFREHFILQLLGIKPTLNGLVELGTGIVDNLVVGPDDATEVASLRSSGFNVIMEDIAAKGKKCFETILKGMGISLKELSVEKGDQDKKPTLEELVTQLSLSKDEPSTSTDEEEEVVTETPESLIEELTEKETSDDSISPTVKLLDTEVRNYDFGDASLTLTQEMVEGLMQELSDEFPVINQKSTMFNEGEVSNAIKTNGEKPESTILFESQEAFTEAVQAFFSSESVADERTLVHGIADAIAKNADMASYAARKFTAEIETQINNPHYIQAYLEILKSRSIVFSRELMSWLIKDLDTADFVTYSQKALIIIKLSKFDTQFVEQVIRQMVDFHITKSVPPKEMEHLRTLIGMITARDVTLQRRAIRSYLSHYEDGQKIDEIWLGLVKFDASLVSLEIIEHQAKLGVKIVQDVLMRKFGSFGHIIYEIFTAYQKGDIQRVLKVAGTLTDSLLRKQKRMGLVEKVKKFGSVPIEILARNVEIEAKELESMIYEMISEGEINAKIDVVEGHLCIVQLNEKEEEEKEGEENPN
ncbi:MAG: PCI domain-containing protein [Candidatus Hodarchaeales archaeon]